MSTLKLGDELCVLIWREGIGERLPLGHPIDSGYDAFDERIEVIGGEVDSVVRIRIESKEPERVVGRVTDDFAPASSEWREIQEILTAQYDFETEVDERTERSRLMIRAQNDYYNQWREQKKNALQRFPNHA